MSELCHEEVCGAPRSTQQTLLLSNAHCLADEVAQVEVEDQRADAWTLLKGKIRD